MKGRVLIVAGSDSGGGAGIQADIKTVTALGGYAATAVTALTAQDTRGVAAVVGVEPEFIARQMTMVLDDIGADCIKTGMLHTSAVIDALCGVLEEKAKGIPLVVDPVMVAKGGASLLDLDASSSLKARLAPIATVLTPNLPEAEVLVEDSIADHGTMLEAAEALLALGTDAVLLKGGHLDGGTIYDVLAEPSGTRTFEYPRIDTRHTHGTGCTLASAVATGLAQGRSVEDAVVRARAFVQAAIQSAPGFGRGHGPLNHAHTVKVFRG